MNSSKSLLSIKRASNPVFCRKRKLKEWNLWKSVTTAALLSDFGNRDTGEISQWFPDLIKTFQEPEAHIVLRLIRYEKKVAMSIKESLLNNGIEAFYYPLTEIDYELVCSSKDITPLMPAIEKWTRSDYFDIIIVDGNYVPITKHCLFEDTQKKGPDSKLLYQITNFSRYVLRKSGDEDELEILTARFTYEKIKNVVEAFARKNCITCKEIT